MSFRRTSLLARLRRHRGLWLVAAMVLVVKFATGALCLADVPPAQVATADAVMAGSVDSTDCVLGEAGGCHCACTHTLPIPSAVALVAATLPVATEARAAMPDYAPVHRASLIRPPIA